jgi:phenylalanyl-tRNA synthetase beta chain
LKFSYRWISELVPGLAAEPRILQNLITMKTAECEGIEAAGEHFASVVVARVASVESLAGRNKLVHIETGAKRNIQVVCGAPNVRPGMLAAWAPPGTVLNGRRIERRLIDGVESEGMLASAAELEINRDHSGLLELEDARPGEPIPGLAPDWIIAIDNKSLTHRPDLWGHIGMAREVAAITGGSVLDPVNTSLLPSGAASIRVEIEDFNLCPRYSALMIEGINVAPSPLWLQARLETLGFNAINNIVDVTNYVLAELPQPMHAFDADKLARGTIFVRRARAGERLLALDGETYELDPADLVIADASGPIALAGVIGGASTAISAKTTRVLLESANFQAASVRLTSARHKLRTDASIRFEKALDPENTLRGIARAIDLLNTIAPGFRPVGGVEDKRTEPKSLPVIALPVDFIVRKLGKEVSATAVTRILAALGFRVGESAPGLLTVTVPSWRATKDISFKDDLAEEVGRMIGYDEITPSAPLVACTVPPASAMRMYMRKIRAQLASQGFTEVYNYSFTNKTDAERFSLDINSHIAIQNPIAADFSHLRTSLLPGIFRNIVNNFRNFREFRIFEIGNEIHSRPPGPPEEIPHAAGAIVNAHGDGQDFYELKRVLECLFPGINLQPARARAYEHPERTADVLWHERSIGRIFELHPSLLEAEGIEGRAVLFDVDLLQSQQIASAQVTKYRPVRKYPTSAFDLSVITDLRTPVAQVERGLAEFAGDALASLEFVRQYSGPPLPSGKKSVSYRFEVAAADHTLSADEVAAIRAHIIEGMQGRGFELRV